MRRDRDDDQLDDAGVDQNAVETASEICQDGWIDRDGDVPQPCLVCRPWLRHRRPPGREDVAHLVAPPHRVNGRVVRIVELVKVHPPCRRS
jgi:hypothetical protein